MDERAIDEFESVFEAAVRPSVKIEPVTWERILVGLDGSDRADAAVQIATSLAKRFGCPVRFVATLGTGPGEDEEARMTKLGEWADAASKHASDAGVQSTATTELGHPGPAIVAEAEGTPTSLVVMPTPHGSEDVPDHHSLGTAVDHLLHELGHPILLVKEPPADVAAVFERMLLYVPGGFEIGPHFSVPFHLVTPSGQLDLLHVVDQDQIDQVAAALEIMPDVDTNKTRAIARSVEIKMEQLLAEAVRTVHDEPYTCSSSVETGGPVERVALKLMRAKSTLLVVDSETQPDTPIQPEAYSIVKEVSGVPILVL